VFKRKIYNELISWKKESDGRTALLIEGQRRVGKSTVVEEFAKAILHITSFKMSPTSLSGGKQTTTAGEHIFQCGRIKAATMLC
jgi:AAA+ ATPase superfamily predicted ATPase